MDVKSAIAFLTHIETFLKSEPPVIQLVASFIYPNQTQPTISERLKHYVQLLKQATPEQIEGHDIHHALRVIDRVQRRTPYADIKDQLKLAQSHLIKLADKS